MTSDILDTINLRALGLELQAARKRKGMRQEDAAKIINVARTTLTAIEKGERRITAAELVKLATAYDCQVSDLVRVRPVVSASPEQYRGPVQLTDEDREAIDPHVERLIEYARRYVELETLLSSPLIRKYPAVYETRGHFQGVAESIALEERQRLSLGDGPLPLLRELMEQYVGLRIFYLPLPRKFSEIYLYDEVLGGCIAVNRLHPEERRRWSLAHGYLHFLAHRFAADVSYNEEVYRPATNEERLAEAFTPNFLMPAAGLKRHYTSVTQVKSGFSTSDLLTMANLYGVSVQALTLRLEDLDLLPAGMWKSLSTRRFPVQEYQEKLGLKPIAGYDDIFPRRYRILALEALTERHISEEQFAAILSTDRLDARAVAEELAGHASSVQDGLEAAGFELRAQIIWAKTRLVFSQGHYHWQHEPCWYGVRHGATAQWAGDRTQTTLWTMGIDPDIAGGHSTQKPLECMARPIRNHGAVGDLVYDPFLGSGTTLIAAHREGRRCYGMEIAPRYGDVILQRAEAEGLIVERVDHA